MISDAVTGALVASITGLFTTLLSNTKCYYSNEKGKCNRSCAYMDRQLLDDKKQEIEIQHYEMQGVDVMIFTKKKPEESDDDVSTPSCFY